MASPWRDALLTLDDGGWDSDDIESACDALYEACDEGEYGDREVGDLSAPDVARILDVDLDDDEAVALCTVASVLAEQSNAAIRLRRALYDLDAFAFAADEEE